jgi:hypothetical protein
MNQLPLFDEFPRRKRTPRELGHAAAQRAADHADREVGNWQAMAYEAFVTFARARSVSFITKDVREWARHVPPPPDRRAWGAVAQRARREGVVVSVCLEEAPHVHGSTITRWVAKV